VNGRTDGRRTWDAGVVVALGMLLSLYDLPARSRQAQAQHPGLGVVLLTPVEAETGGGRYAVLAMTLNPRVRIVAGSLVLVRVGTKEPRPLTGTATHFHEPPYAIAGWIETSCLVPGRYELPATMRGAHGEVDTATLPVMVKPVQRMGRAPCRVTEVLGPLLGWGVVLS
jgi:hypothetical protein